MRQQIKPTTIYVCSRALSTGIVAVEAVPIANLQGYMEGPDLARPTRSHWYGPGSYRLTMQEAIARAEEMRSKRLARMEKQMQLIRDLDFTKETAA